MYTAESYPLIFSARSLGYGLGYRGLAYAGRTYETEYLTVYFGIELSYGKRLNYVLLDLFKSVVIPVKVGGYLFNVRFFL